MRTKGAEAAIARYRETSTKKDARNWNCAQLELRANGERVLGGFTIYHTRQFSTVYSSRNWTEKK